MQQEDYIFYYEEDVYFNNTPLFELSKLMML